MHLPHYVLRDVNRWSICGGEKNPAPKFGKHWVKFVQHQRALNILNALYEPPRGDTLWGISWAAWYEKLLTTGIFCKTWGKMAWKMCSFLSI